MFKRFLLVISSLFVLSHTFNAVAQEENTDSIGEYVVQSFRDIPALDIEVQSGESVTFTLTTCSNPEAPCSVTVYADTDRFAVLSSAKLNRRDLFYFQTGLAMLVCGITIKNGFNAQIARLEQQQPTNFYGTYGKSPFAWSALPTSNATSSTGYVWGNGVSSILPGVGQQSGIGYSRATATLYYLGQGTSHYAQVNFGSANSPWNCLAG